MNSKQSTQQKTVPAKTVAMPRAPKMIQAERTVATAANPKTTQPRLTTVLQQFSAASRKTAQHVPEGRTIRGD